MIKQISRPDDNDQRFIYLGLSVIVIVFFIFGGWLALAPLSGAVVAIGNVSADIYKKTVQHLEGGIVEEILVNNGDNVQQGQVLLKLHNAQVSSQARILKNQYLEALAVKSRLESQINGLSEIQFAPELQQEEQTTKMTMMLKTQKQIFELKHKMIVNDEIITQQRMIQLSKYIDGITSLIKGKSIRLIAINEEITEWQILLKEQLIDKIKIRELSKEKAILEGEIANSKADIAKAEEQINELKSQLLARKKEIQDKLLDEFVGIKNNITEIQSKMVAMEDTEQRLIVHAPISGTVVGLEMHTIGGVIGAGKPLLDIVPESSHFVITAKIQNTDIDKVHPNLFADIRFSAFNTRFTHVIEGKVIQVSADRLIDPRSDTSYYEAKLELTPKGYEQLRQYHFELVAGMPVEVMIKTEERTALNYLLKPFLDMISRSFNEE
ncbi:MAG: HlyD family type I secretion periplasmic adaptor subunit [Clostridia bacterium]